MKREELKRILELHKEWLEGSPKSKKANLSGADLSDVIGLLSPIEFIKDNFKKTAKGILVYKCFGKHFSPNSAWKIEPGSIISETVNPNRQDDCGSGVNVAPLEVVRKNYKNGPIWKCLIRNEWLPGVVVPFGTDGKIRCEKVELIEIVEE